MLNAFQAVYMMPDALQADLKRFDYPGLTYLRRKNIVTKLLFFFCLAFRQNIPVNNNGSVQRIISPGGNILALEKKLRKGK